MAMITVMSNPTGRPPKYKTAEELELKCNEYFRVCDDQKREVVIKNKVTKEDEIVEILSPTPYTVPGLALYLGFIDRHALLNYKGRSKAFYATVKRAMSKIENQRVVGGLTRQRSEPVSIFDLKANFAYREVQELQVTGPGGGPIALTAIPPTPQSLAQWEAMMLESRKAKQIPEKT